MLPAWHLKFASLCLRKESPSRQVYFQIQSDWQAAEDYETFKAKFLLW